MIDLKDHAGSRYRIELDPSARYEPKSEQPWLRRIPCDRRAFIGVHGPKALMAYVPGKRRAARLLAVPGVECRQLGDDEVNVVFPLELLDTVAGILRARRRRHVVLSEAERAARIERLRSPAQKQKRARIPHATAPAAS